MALSVLSMAAGTDLHPQLADLERAWNRGEQLTQPDESPGGDLNWASLARSAWKASHPGKDAPAGIILSPAVDIQQVDRAVGERFSPVGQLPSTEGSVLQALDAAEDWLIEHPQGRLLILLAGDRRAGCIVLGTPNQERTGPSLALIHPPAFAGSPSEAAAQALGRPELPRGELGYLEYGKNLRSLGSDGLRQLEGSLPPQTQFHQVALGSSRAADLDPTGVLAAVHALAAVQHRTLPGTPPPDQLAPEINLEKPAFYTPESPRPWLDAGKGYRRQALLVFPSLGIDSSGAAVITEPDRRPPFPGLRTTFRNQPRLLIPFSGRDQAGLRQDISRLEQELTPSRSLKDLGWARFQRLDPEAPDELVGALVASDRESFLAEISHLKNGFPETLSSGESWSSPAGSYFTPQPLGDRGLAFVYPGAFNSYPGMGQDLFRYFPALHDLIQETTADISHSLAERLLYPRRLHPPTKDQRAHLNRAIYDHPVELIESGTTLSVLLTLVLKEIFQIKPRAAFGYSLGEVSMLWGNQIWQNASQSSQDWGTSSLFRTELFGPKQAVRRHWENEDLEDDFWASYILKAPREEIVQAVEGYPRAYLTIVNTEEEAVIAGSRASCQEIIQDLDCHALPMPFDAAIHNPAMSSTYPDFVDLYTHEVQPAPAVHFYSADLYAPLHQNKTALARALARMTCSPVDFPRLVEQTYQDGCRLFVEVGPQKTCSRWIGKILSGKEHAVIPSNKRYQDDYHGILKTLSLLLSHRVPLNLSPLYTNQIPPEVPGTRENGRLRTLPARPGPPKTRKSAPGPEQNRPAGQSMIQDRFLRDLTEGSTRTARAQAAFLEEQSRFRADQRRLLSLAAGSNRLPKSRQPAREAPLYSTADIQAFTTGDPRDCFGSLFDTFEDRRIPRLPNGPLRFIDRVIDIQGEPGLLREGSSLTSEFDLPPATWYQGQDPSRLPHVALLELALQPCGFLSAYLGTIQDRSHLDYYFRNLDGRGESLGSPGLPGRTITNHIQLLSSSTLGDTIIQNYAFQLSCRGKTFFRGESSFGYFTPEMLKSQAGLDGGRNVPPWMAQHPDQGRWISFPDTPDDSQPPQPALPQPRRAWVSPHGGNHGKGYLYFTYPVHPQAWYFNAHFYQDPVMPGSLGIELASQALQASTGAFDLPPTTWEIHSPSQLNWKYRGQITPAAESVGVEIHLTPPPQETAGTVLTADATLWKGKVRIYQIDNISLVGTG